MNEVVEVDKKWLAWLEYFYVEADFGPADGDVCEMIYQNFKEETGYTIGKMENDE